MDPSTASPFSVPNIRLFLLFRMLFNGRFYYPVFTVLFLDYGLTLNQFAILNAIWAATIVLGEVPSGAMADRIGRKRLVVFASAAMVVEMLLIALVPLGNSALVFGVFALNRILSGLAEAAASGADEALAFDSLLDRGLSDRWPRVLEASMRLQSIAFFFAMGLGAAVYDPDLVNRICGLAGFSTAFAQEDTMRFPVFLTLATAVAAFFVSLRMVDPPRDRDGHEEGLAGRRGTWVAGGWILRTTPVMLLLAAGVLFDSFNRQFVTLASEYYRGIGFPEWSFGLLGSLVAVLGFVLPRFARYLVENWRPEQVALFLAIWTMAAFVGIAGLFRYWGLLFAMMAFVALSINQFALSHYLNAAASSRLRATILSFRGLILNFAYGAVSLGYGWVATAVRERMGVDGEAMAAAVFAGTLHWFAPAFATTAVVLAVFTRCRLGSWRVRFSGEGARPPSRNGQ